MWVASSKQKVVNWPLGVIFFLNQKSMFCHSKPGLWPQIRYFPLKRRLFLKSWTVLSTKMHFLFQKVYRPSLLNFYNKNNNYFKKMCISSAKSDKLITHLFLINIYTFYKLIIFDRKYGQAYLIFQIKMTNLVEDVRNLRNQWKKNCWR